MKLPHPFGYKVRVLFMDKHECWECRRNQNLELHHIRGRCSSSPFNAALVCRECHEHLNQDDVTAKRLLRKTILHLSQEGYKIQKEDEEFLRDCGNLIVDLKL